MFHLKFRWYSFFYNLEEHVHGYAFGWALVQYIRTGREWPDTLIFPRVAYCRLPSISVVGGENAYTAQCALPINMLNEKLYIFLWFWICFLLVINLISLFLWLFRILSPFHRQRFISRYLRVHKQAVQRDPTQGATLKNFVDDYLRRDGIFLVRMLAINVGHVMASDVVSCLWDGYRERCKTEIPSMPLYQHPMPPVPPQSNAPSHEKEEMDIGFV